MNAPDLVGRTIDGKYQMTRELGRGGMGTVYLATHLGTERPVAVKIISPQFMQRAEFVERFRREARAAGRLRHPNVVDVTDFGFSDSPEGQVAYLVMEYLDGCTLGEILDEEKNLPVGWTLDILEQVCSAVHEAHLQGIIHRDLKPDNIWLEPNQRGGYTVKVLDFGIAKLEENSGVTADSISDEFRYSEPTLVGDVRTTFSGAGGTLSSDGSETLVAEKMTGLRSDEGETISLEPLVSEIKTAIYDQGDDPGDQDTVGTRVIGDDSTVSHADKTTAKSLLDSPTTAGLTRVGAVLGTPLYMSPEQCRGEHLDPRSDIYSLGVIAYQMLSGRTPFEGDYKDVMRAHQELPVPPLVAKNVRKKMRRAIFKAMDKDPEKRPQTADGFVSELRARSEGLFGLLKRSLVIYSEHLPKFLALTAFFSLPVIILTLAVIVLSFLKVGGSISDTTANITIGLAAMASSFASIFCTYLNLGTITWIVTQHLLVPLRPIRLRPALLEARKKWKAFFGTGVLQTILMIVFGVLTCGIGFIVFSVMWTLVAPVVMMEDLKGRAALKRSKDLVKRSVWTAAGAVFILFLMPAIIAGTISIVVNLSAAGIDRGIQKAEASAAQQTADANSPAQAQPEQDSSGTGLDQTQEKPPDFEINWARSRRFNISGGEMDMRSRVKMTFLESLIQLIWMPMSILVVSFSGIIISLLYIKTRLAGGESVEELAERFEDDSRPRKKWQERVRQRLIQSGRISNRSASNEVESQ